MNTSPTLSAPIIKIISASAPVKVERFVRKFNRECEKRCLPWKLQARDNSVEGQSPTPTVIFNATRPDGRPFVGKASLVKGVAMGDPTAPMPMASSPNIGADGRRAPRDVLTQTVEQAVLPSGGPAEFNEKNVRDAVLALAAQGGIQIPFTV
jgi:hypothetical protein